MGGLEEGKQLGHRKTQAFGAGLTWVYDPELPLNVPAL